MEILGNFIDGKFQLSKSKKNISNINPAINKIYSKIPDSDQRDIDIAVQVAKSCLSKWSSISVKERASFLNAVADEIENRKNEIAYLEMIDCGKTFRTALRVDVDRAVQNFRFYAQQIRMDCLESFQGIAGLNYTQRIPIGICGLITPWNLPLYLLSWKVAPALACGNTVVCKPSELTPRTTTELAYIIRKLGVPNGVFNVIHGTGLSAGQPLVTHPDVNAISFTGGTKTGSLLGSLAGRGIKKVSLELGGKNPGIIFADCNLEQMLCDLTRACFANQGQVCLTMERLFIEKTIINKVLKIWKKKLKLMLEYGDPNLCNFGSLISQEHRTKVEFYIQLAQEEGGKIFFGGQRPSVPSPFVRGAFLEPTIVTGLSYTSRCATEEVFGPFVTVHPFANESELIKMANHVKYGLSCSIWTTNINVACRVAQKVNVGMVWINGWCIRDLRTPFGGMGKSGLGREGGMHSLEFYSQLKNICINIEEQKIVNYK